MTAHRPSRPTAQTSSDGFILVTVLWILGALAALVSIYSVYVSNTAMAAAVRNDDLLARSLVTAGVELAAYRILATPKDKRPTDGEVVFRMGQARIVATFRTETARIDLNAAPKELLAGLFVTLGAREEDAEQYAERIIAWRSPATAAPQDGEASLYQAAGLDYGPRGAPFVHVDELWLVVDLPPALVERALPYLTVFSGRAEVHARKADPVVLASLPGSSPEGLNQTVPESGSANDTPAARPGTTMEAGDAMRVTVGVDFGNGQVRTSEAVILVRDFGDDPYRVLSWRDDVDVSAGEPRMQTEPRR